MKIELLAINGNWIKVAHKTVEDTLNSYPNAILVTETNEHNYYASNNEYKILFRMTKPEQMTKKQAEKKFEIKIKG